MDLFSTIRGIYTKRKVGLDATKQEIIGLLRWLAMDRDNLPFLKRINQYLLYLSPTNMLILLYFGIKAKERAPYIEYIKKTKKDALKPLYARIQGYFGWSNREFRFNRKYLASLDIKIWRGRLGLK